MSKLTKLLFCRTGDEASAVLDSITAVPKPDLLKAAKTAKARLEGSGEEWPAAAMGRCLARLRKPPKAPQIRRASKPFPPYFKPGSRATLRAAMRLYTSQMLSRFSSQ